MASLVATWAVFGWDLSGIGAMGGILVGLTGGALARIKTYQVALTAVLWGAVLGPIVGLGALALGIVMAGVGM